MKKTTLTIALSLTFFCIFAQDIAGQWNGVLNVQGTSLRLVFNVSKTAEGYTSTMDSPDQGAKGLPVTRTTLDKTILTFDVSNLRIKYEGSVKTDSIIGTFKQGGQSLPLNLTRAIQAKTVVKRPQNPVKPYPYYAEDVKFKNEKANITLAGTLTLPKKEGVYPVVVLISGSGPQNRDEEILGHKPFLVLSDYLTKNGIGVLRFDDRGTAESEGIFKNATTKDLATDALAAVNFLKTRKDINQKHIGLIGHSEGGLIAPMVAAESDAVNFIVLMAGTGIQGNELLLLQEELVAKASGVSAAEIEKTTKINKGAFDIVVKSTDTAQLTTDLSQYAKNIPASERPEGLSDAQLSQTMLDELTNPWMIYFLKYNPALILEKVKCGVLAINGEKDVQVPAKINLAAIKNGLEKGGNKNVIVKEFPKLNHLFQECETGGVEEYAKIEQTIAPNVLAEIGDWIKKRVK
jgi:uncharacterized protein